MAIYTRTGDKGKTSLFSGLRVLKSDLRVETYGTIDELNSAIGVVLSETSNKRQEIRSELIKIQNDLLDIGSALANPENGKCPATAGSRKRREKMENGKLSKRVRDFERFIDQMTAKMPALKNFILPGGGKAGAMLHLARAICRRAERRIVELNNPSAGSGRGKIDNNIIIYVNRLSDLLFTMARFANFKEKKKEVIWSGRK